MGGWDRLSGLRHVLGAQGSVEGDIGYNCVCSMLEIVLLEPWDLIR